MGCTSRSDDDRQYLLQGAWTLRKMDYPIGHTRTFTDESGTLLRLYDGDSVMYQCWLTRTKSGLAVKPIEQQRVQLIDKGHGEYVYIEGDDPYPLTIKAAIKREKNDAFISSSEREQARPKVKDDTTIVIQQNGILNTWHCADDIAREWGEEIKELVSAPTGNGTDEAHSYILSAKERQQANVIHWLVAATIGIVTLLLLIIRIAIDYRKDRRRLQLQLQQIQEVQQERPPVVRQAIESVEAAYFKSDEYLSLQRRIATGQRLKDDDWDGIERQMRGIWPGFSSQLRGLYAMSELEYQVCLLVKLRIPPTDIAAVLTRDASTISTVRSRLYKKVFGRKGGARKWDEFILSI